MGTVFKLPIVRWEDFESELSRCSQQHGIELWATVLEDDAQPLERVPPVSRVGILFGNEAQGLEPAVISRCHKRVTIPMKLGTDSLNVTVSAGIFLYVLTGHRDKML